MSQESNLNLTERQTIHVTVRANSPDVDYVRADGPDGRQYVLNRRVMGDLWGKVAVGDVLEVDIYPDPGKATRIVAVRRPAIATK